MSAQTRGAAVADAVIAELNAATWPFSFVAARNYVVDMNKADTRTMQVIVQHTGTSAQQITRKHRRETHGILISVRMNVDPTNKSAVDSLEAFTESVADHFRAKTGTRKIDNTEAHVTAAEPVPASPDELQSNRQFFGGVSLAAQEIVVYGVSLSGGVPAEA